MKKLLDKVPALKEDVLNRAMSPQLGQYVWKHGIGPQMGYSFSVIHALAYSFIGFQTAFLGVKYPLFWNTACLIVNSGMLDESDEDADYEEDETGKVKSTNYSKNAKALGELRSKNIEVSLIDINNSSFGFKPDVENNTILYGLKGVNKVGDPVIEQIIAGRPYTGIQDFMMRCPLKKDIMISLIKAGAFDKTDEHWAKELSPEPRLAIMAFYISKICEPKSKLTLQNFNGLMQRDLIPESLLDCKQVFVMNNYLKNFKCKDDFLVNEPRLQEALGKYYSDIIKGVEEDTYIISQATWKKFYDSVMDKARAWLKTNQTEILETLNTSLFMESWKKYATGSISAWEMEALCFYYHPHELANVDTVKYGISDFESLPTIPVVEKTFRRNGVDIPIFETTKIIGTVIGKNDTKSTVSLLTATGVVSVKMTKEYFANYNKQISQLGEDGKKHVLEKGWFTRGTKIMCTGFRRDDMFVCKSYKHTSFHQLYRITSISSNGIIELTHERHEDGKMYS